MDCAILVWTLVFISTIINKTEAANIKIMETSEHVAISHSVNITRSHDGDIIIVKDMTECDDNLCMEVSTSTAMKYRKSLNSKNDKKQCKCQCLPHLRTFREDTAICVNDIGECSLIPFVSSSIATDTAERIPFVFLPLKGQIIYPSKELLFANEFENMNCVVVGGVLLTSNGWAEMRTLFNSGDIPFRIFVDEQRKFLQWTGDSNIRNMMQGRLVMIHLACRVDGLTAKTVVNTSPCVSFRVVGSPIKTTSNVTEVQFQETSGNEKEILSTNEYFAIAITSFCLGLMYIASVFLYIYLKKKKDQTNTANSEDLNKNFSREDSSDFHNGRSSYRRNSSLGPSVEFLDNPEPHVVKNNPLMKHFMSFNENNGFMSDSSDAESSNVHNEGQNNFKNFSSEDDKSAVQMSSGSECLPEEDVSITEDSDNKSENNRTFHNGSIRRKLYFNPAYFEQSLLASPPPAAIEFLTKIREVITMAKGKMSAKRFQPSLNGIPEEGSEMNGTMNSRKSSVVSSRRASTKDCSGCPGCEARKNSDTPKNCKNCGDKQKSIQKWLENVSTATDSSGSDTASSKRKKKKLVISLPIMEEDKEELLVSKDREDSNENEIKNHELPFMKGYVKEKNIFIQRDTLRYKDDISEEAGGSIPKIISHSLKKNIKDMIYSQNFVRDKVSIFEPKPINSITNKFEANEIYNNPKFNIDQDCSDTLRPPYSSVIKKKVNVLDQFAKPKKLTDPSLPDMIYEAVEMEKKNKPNNYSLPTPDYYSSEYEMMRCKNSDGVSFIPFVPTPDYHTYGKNTLRQLKQYQPDSPIYSRKSPAYLVVDYETDSLERLNTYKGRSSLATSTRSDFSSQASPSALPMEEEVEIRNAIYDREEGFRKDTDTIKKEREIDIQMRKSKIMYNTPNEGSMTIELEAISPEDTDEISNTDSDQFEPDTLDRHSKINRTVLEKMKTERNNFENEILSRAEDEKEKLEMCDEMGRTITLEVRHSKRQRNMGFASLEKLPEQSTKKEKQKPEEMPSVTPDVISSNKPMENIYETKNLQNSPRVTNQHILNEHEFKKTLISPPILTFESDVAARKVYKTLRGDSLNMEKIDTNFHQNRISKEYKPSLIKTVYHVELPSPPNLDKEIFASGKKSKDFKNAWRRFIGITEKNSHDSAVAEIHQGKVKDIIKRLNVGQIENGRKEYDSGYLSAESNKETQMTDIILKPEINDKTIRITRPRPLMAPPPPPLIKNNKYLNNNDDLVNINIYSSDDEPLSSIASDDDTAVDDGTESGTESWKFFKT